jgi:hypothetical protein
MRIAEGHLATVILTPAGAGRFGNAGVGILQGPGTTAASLGLAKVFRVTEGVRMHFESTFTNVFTHTNFAPPATQIDVPSTFGVLSAPQTAENAGIAPVSSPCESNSRGHVVSEDRKRLQ